MNDNMKRFVRGLLVGMVSRGVMPTEAQWETLWEGAVTTTEGSLNGATYSVNLTDQTEALFVAGEIIRLTVDGVSTVFTAVDANQTYSDGAVGNEWLWDAPGTTDPDTGYDYLVWTICALNTVVPPRITFYSRYAGTYNFKIERMVS